MNKSALLWFVILALALGACAGQPVPDQASLDATAASLAGTMIVQTQAALPAYTATPSPVPPTETPGPPTETSTPEPTATETATPTETPTETPTAALNVGLVNYYLQTGTDGPVGCGDTLVPVYIGQLPTGDPLVDTRTVLTALFAPKGQFPYGLYNPLWLSSIQITDVYYAENGEVAVTASGNPARPEKGCEWDRIRAQVNATLARIPGVTSVEITLNNRAFNDIFTKDR